MNSTFNGISDETLTANLAAIKNMPGMDAMVALIEAEQKFRVDNAAEIAAHAELVGICRKASETLASVRHSRVAAISDPDGTVVKNARLTLHKLLMATFGVNAARADKIVMVLMDEHQQTDAAGDVEKAAAYVAAHPTGSTVYNATRPDDADKGSDAPAESDGHASTEALNAAVAAGEKASDDSKASK